MRERLSVTIVCVDAQEKIRACLESVAWADEIVVCDSGSCDETLAICAQYTDHIYTDPWRGFGAHKNLALERASHPWVLSLDADERVCSSCLQTQRKTRGPVEARPPPSRRLPRRPPPVEVQT